MSVCTDRQYEPDAWFRINTNVWLARQGDAVKAAGFLFCFDSSRQESRCNAAAFLL